MPSLPPDLLTNWLQPGAIVAGAVGGLGLLITAFGNVRAELKEEMKEIRVLLIQALQLSPAAKP